MPTDPPVRTDAPEHADPRIRRTREHVLNVTRELLMERKSALTLSLVAERARVSRQTLYKHWATIENVIADTVVVSRTRSQSDYEGLEVKARAELFFREIVETLNPAMASASATIIAALHYDRNAGYAFRRIDTGLFEAFTEAVGPVSHDQYIELCSPVVMTVLALGTVSDQMIASLGDRAAQLIR